MTQFASTLYPQTNPTNPILLEFRLAGSCPPESYFARVHASLRRIANGRWDDFTTLPQRLHAIRVLERLANFTG